MSTFHFGRCWTRGLHSVPVVAGQAVYVPLRSLLDACPWHAATPALSNTGTQRRALRSACGMSTLPLRSVLDKRHWRLAPRAHTVLSANVRASGQASLPVCASACRAFIINFHAALGAAPPRMKARIAPCLRHSRNPAPKYSDFPLPTAARPHTLGLSNVQTQGQVNLPLRLPT